MSVQSRLTSYQSFPIRSHFGKSFLCQVFRKSVEKIKKIQIQVKKIGEGSHALGEKLSVFALHYLAKGAKIPIKNSHLSYLEFYADNNPKYFRSQGGSFIKIFMTLLQQGPYKFLFQPYGNAQQIRDSIQPVKHENFREFIKLQTNYVEVPSQNMGFIEEFSPELSQTNPDYKIFLDVSSLLSSPGQPVSPKALKRKIHAVKKAIRKNPHDLSSTIIGAFVKLNNGQTVCILLNDGKLRVAENDVEKLISDEEDFVKNMKAHSGYFPDIIEIRRSIIRQGLKLEELTAIAKAFSFEETPETPGAPSKSASSITPTTPVTFKSLKDRLNALHRSAQNKCQRFYYNLFAKLLIPIEEGVSKQEKSKTELDLIDSGLQEIDSILTKMERLTQSKDYTQFLGEVDLLTEEIVYLLTIVDPFEGITLASTLNQEGIVFRSRFAEKATYTFTSGMNGFAQVFSALRKQSQATGQRLNIGFSDTNYFELRLEVLPHLTQHFNVAKQPTDPFNIKQDYDVFFMDIYPNEVTKFRVDYTDPITVLGKLLQNKKEAASKTGKAISPLTVVIDTSTTLFSSTEIQKVVNKYQKEIDDGLLNIVVVNSLAKFSMCGLDKYTGGVVQTYNNRETFLPFNTCLQRRQQQEPLSPEAERFFHLFFKGASTEIDGYLAAINTNTHSVYKKFAGDLHLGSPKKTLMTLSDKPSEHIPMLSFHFSTLITDLIRTKKIKREELDTAKSGISIIMQHYIHALAKSKDLPMDSRTSFGFAHANINSCWTALRLTIGLEDPAMLEQYQAIFLQANRELESVWQDPDFIQLILKGDSFFAEALKDSKKREALFEAVQGGDQSLGSFLRKLKEIVLDQSSSAKPSYLQKLTTPLQQLLTGAVNR